MNRPELFVVRFAVGAVTSALVAWCREASRYGADGRFSCYVRGDPAGGPEMFPPFGAGEFDEFPTVVFQAYADGGATTDWHDDASMTGDSAILSIGSTRRFQIRPHGTDDVLSVEVPEDSLVWMAARFHSLFEHRIGPEPVDGPRWSFVFRTKR